MIVNNLSAGQIQRIHEQNMQEFEEGAIKIAEQRIEKYFKGELKLSWKSIIYEINKLPELSRVKYFEKLVDNEKEKAKQEGFKNGHKEGRLQGYQEDKLEYLEAIAQWSIWTFLKERKRAPEWIKLQKRFMNKKGN